MKNKPDGWIKLHRKILDNPISEKPTWAWLWIYLLLRANHQDKEFIFNGEKTICRRGQILTGRTDISKSTRIPPTTVERILNYLESEHQIGQEKTSKNRLITIRNYNQYQQTDSKADSKKKDKRTTSGQQADTNKNIKNDKEVYIEPSAQGVDISKEYVIKTPVQRIVCQYKMCKGFGYDDRKWDKLNFTRCSKSAKQLYDYFKEDSKSEEEIEEEVIECIIELADKFDKKGFEWTFETIVKHMAEHKLKKERR